MTTIDLGEVIELHAGDATVRIYPDHGGRLGHITVRGEELLRGPDMENGAELGWGYWGCYALLPWSNRIPAGQFRFEGRDLAVPVSWSDGSAIHGLTADVPWRVEARDDATVVEEIDVDTGPFRVRGRQRFEMTATHLDLRLEVMNAGDDRVPVGLGIHPWFMAGQVSVPASETWPGDTPLPTGPARAVEPAEDLRSLRIPPPMDRCFTGLTATSATVPGLTISWSDEVTQVIVYSESEGYVCVEPVTMANDGFGLLDRGIDGHGVVALDPGQTFGVGYRFSWA
jgi:aldose 1-epimerase